MTTTITDKLNYLAQSENVTILLAIESGSRAWGFHSPDSDYDARFIYMHPRDYYLGIEDKRDVIELPVDAVLDINGWDVRKALKLMSKANGPVFEWIQSPIIYNSHQEFHQALKELMPLYFNPRAMFHHYFSMSKAVTESPDLAGTEVKLKKYFYVLRPLLACRWIVERNEVPPMEFGKLRELLDKSLNPIVDDLLEQKSKVGEKFTIKPIVELHSWFAKQREYCERHTPAPSAEKIDLSPLNSLFRNLLK